MKTRIRKPKFQEKVVFSVEIENENLESTYDLRYSLALTFKMPENIRGST